MIFTDFCREKGCEHYIEWELEYGQPTCYSCTIYGQSYDIEVYPDDCPYLTEIKEYEKNYLKHKVWEKLKHKPLDWVEIGSGTYASSHPAKRI